MTLNKKFYTCKYRFQLNSFKTCVLEIAPIFRINERRADSTCDDTNHGTKHNTPLNLTCSLSNTSPITLQIPNMVTVADAAYSNGVRS